MYRIFRLRWLLVVLILSMNLHVKAQTQRLQQLGAEIYLEPGQTPQQVDHWVKELSDNKMPIARVFMMWNYLEPKPGEWDFTLYDALFRAAEKYGVKITATLVPNSPPFFWGKDFFYITHIMRMYPKKEYRERSKSYIKKVVERYKNSPALDSWWLYNEPSGIPHVEKFAVDEFKKWLKVKYNWETKEKNQVVILADVRCLTMQDIKGIETFVRNGNKIIATGLTGLFDENEKTWVVNREFPLARTFGGSIQEIFSESGHFRIKLDEYKDSFPMQLWYTQILPGTGKVVGKYDGKPIAVRNNYGDGTVLWIPAMIDIGAWADNDNSLAYLLRKETELATKNIPFRFDALHKDCFMHTLKTAEGYITVIVNGNSDTEKIDIISSKTDRAKLLYGEGWDAAQHLLTITPSETVVLKWE